MLNKQRFWNLVNIRYGKPLSETPRAYVCGSSFSTEQILTCKNRGFVKLSHKRLKNLNTSLFKEEYHNIRIEPILQKLTDKQFEQRTADTFHEARLDVIAQRFWPEGQISIFLTWQFSTQTLPDMPTNVSNNIMLRTKLKRGESITTK